MRAVRGYQIAVVARSRASLGLARSRRRRGVARRCPKGSYSVGGRIIFCAARGGQCGFELRQTEYKDHLESVGWAYTNQGERPSMDLVRQVLMSCGMSWTVHKIAPIAMMQRKEKNDKIMDILKWKHNCQCRYLWFRKCSPAMHSRAF